MRRVDSTAVGAVVRGPASMDEQQRWPKKCRCGETWSRDEWNELPPIGVYNASAEDVLELRTCVCGANLAVPTKELEA